jgi:hypothetical protein
MVLLRIADETAKKPFCPAQKGFSTWNVGHVLLSRSLRL